MAKEEKEKKVKKVQDVEVKEEHECACGKDCKCKKGKVGRVFFVVGLVIVLCAVSFAVGMVSGAKFIYEDDMIEEVDKEDKEEEKTEDKTDMSQVEKDLLKRVEEMYLLDTYNRSFESTDNLLNIELLHFGFTIALGENWDESAVVTLDEINKIVQQYFGKSVTGENIPCDLTAIGAVNWEDTHPPMFVYNKKEKNFTYNLNHGGHGGMGYDVLNRVVKVENVEDNIYTIEVKKAFAMNEFMFTDYYPTYQDAYERTNRLFGAPDCDDITVCENYNPTEDFKNTPDSKLISYKYTFEKTNDGYILTNYTFGK